MFLERALYRLTTPGWSNISAVIFRQCGKPLSKMTKVLAYKWLTSLLQALPFNMSLRPIMTRSKRILKFILLIITPQTQRPRLNNTILHLHLKPSTFANLLETMLDFKAFKNVVKMAKYCAGVVESMMICVLGKEETGLIEREIFTNFLNLSPIFNDAVIECRHVVDSIHEQGQ